MTFTPQKPVTPEKRVQNAVVTLLRFHGWFVQRNHQQGIGMTNGRPDLEAYKNGFTLFVECKSPERELKNGKKAKGTLSRAQVQYIEQLKTQDMTVIVTDDPEKFMLELEAIQERLWPGKGIRRIC